MAAPGGCHQAGGRQAGRIGTPTLLGLAVCALLLLVVLVVEAVDSDVPTRAAGSIPSDRAGNAGAPATRVGTAPTTAPPVAGGQRTPPAAAGRWPRGLAVRMAAKVTFTLIDKSLPDAFDRLSGLIGAPIILDGPGDKAQVNLTVTLQVDNAAAEDALARVCNLAGLAHAWCDGAIFVASAPRIAQVRKQHREFRRFQQPPTDELAAKATQAISVRLRDARLRYFLDLFGRSAGLDVTLAGRAPGAPEPTLSLALTNVPADRVLRWAARLTSRVCIWRRDKLLITTPALARAAGAE